MSENNINNGEFREVPETMPVIPISGTMIYPFMVVPFFVSGATNEKAVDAAMSGDHYIFASAIKEPSSDAEQPDPEHLQNIGTVASVLRMMRVPTGGIKIMAQGLFRGKASEIKKHSDGYLLSSIELLRELPFEESPSTLAVMRTLRDQIERSVQLGKPLPQEFLALIRNIKEPGKLADLVSSTIEIEPGDAQTILEQLDTVMRLQFVSRLVARELEILEIQNKIKSNVQTEVEGHQRKYFLREQLKAIQKELGEEDPRSTEIEELRRTIEKAGMPEQAEKQALNELGRLSRMHPDAAESSVIRTYIDWMIALPWKKSTADRLDLALASRVLDEDHYGLDKVKERIIETLAVRKLNPGARSPILCFVGPPGVGKTSLGQSIARALDRKFVRFSAGGVRDEAEIRGHRRTYVGSLPGRIINSIKNAGSNNPVFMIDEIDKIGMDFRGDPSSALLEVLDPEQNSTFTDHYLDVPFDLSNVMFITTANVLDTIPGPLRDRMEILQLPGYTEEEKLNIAKKYLIPRQIRGTGLDYRKLSFHKSAIQAIVRGYTREAGVRNLEREIGSVCRKIATRVARGSRKKTFSIAATDIHRYLGAPHGETTPARRKDQVGVVNGLAWTPTGGEVLTIEALLMDGKGELILTGQLGDVMKESVRAALSYARSRAESLGFSPPGEKKDIHVHVPAGAVPKDGPSAGVAMFTALLSIFMKKPVRRDVAMTGEISLRGAVFPIGGLKQKLLAARREGIKTVLVPSLNRNDIANMKKKDTEGLRIIYVDAADDILPYVFNDGKKKKKPKAARIRPKSKS
jgi:ATP-dependent Lon protease